MKFLRKSSPIFCILVFILVGGCSSKEIVYTPELVIVTTPESLLVDPCEAISAGDSVRSLAKGYVTNTSCIGKYKLLLEKQREYRDKIIELYKKPENKEDVRQQ